MQEPVRIRKFAECAGKHTHEYPQIMVPLQKDMNIRIESTEYVISTQELCLIPAGVEHECLSCGQILAINLSSRMADIQNLAMLTHPLIISMQQQILRLVDLIQMEITQNPNSKSVDHLYNYLYSKLLENYMPPSIHYINEHYDLPITVSQLAEIENYNVTHYINWFKQQTGLPPSLYLRNIRIDKAKELLNNTNFGVVDIALMVGYSSNASFTRAFRSMTGIPPKEYRDCHDLKKIG